MSKRKKPPSQRPHRRDKEEAGEKLTADRKWIWITTATRSVELPSRLRSGGVMWSQGKSSSCVLWTASPLWVNTTVPRQLAIGWRYASHGENSP
jgi:hypothetical protein